MGWRGGGGSCREPTDSTCDISSGDPARKVAAAGVGATHRMNFEGSSSKTRCSCLKLSATPFHLRWMKNVRVLLSERTNSSQRERGFQCEADRKPPRCNPLFVNV